ncbi:hypothetical protein Pcinc_025771 [Petrolisthes cinctipes]|uniref:Uncharacterized protein n=1 Tax=Petrolisthes cinctipes TaxID=88211 RepID=A0AAE1F9U8_PETCI|nr:hypothetical protein Pcinc_025771 [Petrolisthes cinctipes]
MKEREEEGEKGEKDIGPNIKGEEEGEGPDLRGKDEGEGREKGVREKDIEPGIKGGEEGEGPDLRDISPPPTPPFTPTSPALRLTPISLRAEVLD